MAWFLKHYCHDECGASWTDEWSCACNDRCPECDAEIEPYDYEDLTVIVEEDFGKNEWLVLVSPDTAEDKPNYATYRFETKLAASLFAQVEREQMSRIG